MDIPFKDVVFDTSDPHGSALSLLPLLFPDRKIYDMRISALTQGTTNGVSIPSYWATQEHGTSFALMKIYLQLFKITVDASTADSATADAVLIKVYGDGTDITIDRESTYPCLSISSGTSVLDSCLT
jgi:ethanolamine kinase